jgi:hypothetical protein
METNIPWDKVALVRWLTDQIDTETLAIENADSAENEYEYAYATGARDAFTASLTRLLREE